MFVMNSNTKDVVYTAIYRMATGVGVAQENGKIKDLEAYVLECGYTMDDVDAVNNFINNQADEDFFFENSIKLAFDDYINGLKAIKEHISTDEMAKGYEEMGNINLQIAEEHAQLKDEGVNVDEMDKENSQ